MMTLETRVEMSVLHRQGMSIRASFHALVRPFADISVARCP
ncbi:hypothetical protein WKI72_21075 [Candidatus Erwinia dacicola]